MLHISTFTLIRFQCLNVIVLHFYENRYIFFLFFTISSQLQQCWRAFLAYRTCNFKHTRPAYAMRRRPLVPRVGTLYFYFLTNPSLLIKWRLENNLTSLMSGHEFYCYCILINFIVWRLVNDSLSFPSKEGSSITYMLVLWESSDILE